MAEIDHLKRSDCLLDLQRQVIQKDNISFVLFFFFNNFSLNYIWISSRISIFKAAKGFINSLMGPIGYPNRIKTWHFFHPPVLVPCWLFFIVIGYIFVLLSNFVCFFTSQEILLCFSSLFGGYVIYSLPELLSNLLIPGRRESDMKYLPVPWVLISMLIHEGFYSFWKCSLYILYRFCTQCSQDYVID